MKINFTFSASRYRTATECSFKRLQASNAEITILGSGNESKPCKSLIPFLNSQPSKVGLNEIENYFQKKSCLNKYS